MATSTLLFGHGKETHEEEDTDQTISITESSEVITNQPKHLVQINLSYQKNIKPIFVKKCFDCHGTITEFPWYYQVPGIKQLMDSDIKEAKEHLDMTNDFPFGGHGDPISDLKSLKKSIENGTMPIFMYRLMHPNSKLTNNEQQILFKWIDEAIISLDKN